MRKEFFESLEMLMQAEGCPELSALALETLRFCLGEMEELRHEARCRSCSVEFCGGRARRWLVVAVQERPRLIE